MNWLIRRYRTHVWHRRWYWLFLILLLLIILWFAPSLRSHDMFIPLVAVSLSFIYFLHQDHLQIARFCKELVTDFSKRYDQMNEKLQRALQKTGDFNEKETLDFVDYFNLCAEEYLFYKLGYIHRSIWWTWEKGMEQYGADARVVAIWMREKVTDSYYGFKFPVQIVP